MSFLLLTVLKAKSLRILENRHFEDLLSSRKGGLLYDSASVAEMTAHFEELFLLRKPALRTVN
jgi:hypothetical protein